MAGEKSRIFTGAPGTPRTQTGTPWTQYRRWHVTTIVKLGRFHHLQHAQLGKHEKDQRADITAKVDREIEHLEVDQLHLGETIIVDANVLHLSQERRTRSRTGDAVKEKEHIEGQWLPTAAPTTRQRRILAGSWLSAKLPYH